jgi:PD-(D/E)XK endonuclease
LAIGHPYDLVVDLGERDFLRVQCKRAWPLRGCVVFNCRSTDHGRGTQSYLGLADIFGVFFPPTSAVYLVPLDAIAQHEGRLRIDPPLNNQRQGIRLAEEFEIDRWTRDSLRDHLNRAVFEPELELNFA